jgi:H+/Cl- antiporter ClcA
MAAYMNHMPEHNMVGLWSRGKTYDTQQLWILLLTYTLQMVILPGTKIPMGSTIPNLFIGSILGRLMGEYMKKASFGARFWPTRQFTVSLVLRGF